MTTPIDNGSDQRASAFTLWCWVSDTEKVALSLIAFGSFVVVFFLLPPLWLAGAKIGALFVPVLLLLAVAPMRMTIGDDGVQWMHFLPPLTPRFISYAEIDLVDETPKGFVLVLHTGRRVPIYSTGVIPSTVLVMRAAVRSRASAWSNREQRLSAPSAAIGAGAYRSENVMGLLEVATDPGAPPKERTAAVEALAPIRDSEVRAALVVTLSATAEPNVRRALQKILATSAAKARHNLSK